MPFRPLTRFLPHPSVWGRLLRDPERPARTSLSVGLGALVGATPILGVHTWLAAVLAGLFRLPPAAAVLGSNLSNPLTVIPLTLLEIRCGSWLLGRTLPPLSGEWSWSMLAPYLGAAWVGTVPVGVAMGVLSGGAVYLLLRLRARRSAPRATAQSREAKGSRSE
jgi:hypothetical protein